MNWVLFYMKQGRHRTDCLSFVRKLEAQGFCCRICGVFHECGESEKDVPEDSDGGERILVITDDAKAARICELQKIACIGYCPPGSEENEESDPDQYTKRNLREEAEGKSAAEENRDSIYFPYVRMVWESFENRTPEELEQFWCRFYKEPVIITRTGRLLIRESVPEDFEALYRIESDEEISAWDDGKNEEKFPDKERERFCSYIELIYPFYGYGYWTVELTEPGREGTIIGRCGLRDFDPAEDDGCIVMKMEGGDGLPQSSVPEALPKSESGQEADFKSRETFPPEEFCLELGYAVAKPYRRQGFAYEMCRAVLDYAFQVLGADTAAVRIRPQNRASLGLARKLGFHQEHASVTAGDR